MPWKRGDAEPYAPLSPRMRVEQPCNPQVFPVQETAQWFALLTAQIHGVEKTSDSFIHPLRWTGASSEPFIQQEMGERP
jgi:hypothetical protein